MRSMTPRVKELIERAAAAIGSVAAMRLLDGITASDFGLPERLQRLHPGEAWQEDELWTSPSFRASLFVMPAGGTMPLHGHPGMDVLLKVLWGRLRVRSYDWAEGRPGLARATSDRNVSPSDDPQRVGPRLANLHRLDALEGSAFLDLVVPDYSDEDGRPCLYYEEEQEVCLGGKVFVSLRSVPAPRSRGV